MTDDDGFTLEQAMAAQRALRATLGLGEETFPLAAFVGMVSDEIQQLREAGRSDREIAAIIAGATGRRVDHEDLQRFYASEDERRGGHRPD